MKKIILLLLFSIVTFLVYPRDIELVKVSNRPVNPPSLSKGLKQEIKAATANKSEKEIIVYCKDKTRELLKFSIVPEEFNEKKKSKANCVGYAHLCSAICNTAFAANGIKAHARPVVGHVYYNGVNLNDFSKYFSGRIRNNTKDHDFVEVQLSDQTIVFVDASLNVVNF